MKKTFQRLVGLIAITLISFNSHAVTATASFPVSTTVSASCALSSVSGITFPSYTSAADSVGTGSIATTCTKTTPYTLSLNAGSGTMATRTLGTTGADKLNYNIYTTNAYTAIVGDGTASSVTIGGIGNGVAQNTTLYGKIPANQSVTPGSYSETLTVTISY